jgi:hypothetical protein
MRSIILGISYGLMFAALAMDDRVAVDLKDRVDQARDNIVSARMRPILREAAKTYGYT